MHLEALHIADHQQGRILQVVSIVCELDIGRFQIAVRLASVERDASRRRGGLRAVVRARGSAPAGISSALDTALLRDAETVYLWLIFRKNSDFAET
jgi:hypothetical protein